MKGLEKLNELKDVSIGTRYVADKRAVKIVTVEEVYKEHFDIIYKELKEGEANKNASEILRIIFNAPFIIETLVNKKELGKSASDRYLRGTITNEEVQKIKEFFSDGKI